jgi:hypothetical protein
MTQRILVRLKGGYLDVEDGEDGIEVYPSADGDSIEWQLTGAGLQGCKFPDFYEDLPPIAWIYFTGELFVMRGEAVVSQGRHLSVDVDHFGPESIGDTVYMLRVSKPGGGYYTTTHHRRIGKSAAGRPLKGRRTINNPVIINKGDRPLPPGKKKT